METAKPILSQAKEFSEGVKKVWPNKWLAYNLSPSFNWDAAGLSTQQMQGYIWELGKLGFVWQFITVSLMSPIVVMVEPDVIPSSAACTPTPTSQTNSPRLMRKKA